jgi:hypothetical protein
MVVPPDVGAELADRASFTPECDHFKSKHRIALYRLWHYA